MASNHKTLEHALLERGLLYSAAPFRDFGAKTFLLSGDILASTAQGDRSADQIADALLAALPDGVKIYDLDGRIFRMMMPKSEQSWREEYIIVFVHPDWPRMEPGGMFPAPARFMLMPESNAA